MLVTALSNVAVAQSIPPDVAKRQLQRERQLNEYLEQKRRNQEPEVRVDPKQFTLPSTEIPAKESPCFIIDNIDLSGEGADKFTWALDKVLFPVSTDEEVATAESSTVENNTAEDILPLLGRCYGAQGINIIMRRIQNEIIQRGFITTRVVAGPQQLSTGRLTLTLIPGRIAAIRFSDAKHPAKTALAVTEGAVLNLRDIEQSLENLKSLSNVATDIQIVPSEGENAQAGDSDLLIVWSQGRPWRILLSSDDSGTEATGVYVGNLSLAYENLFGLNDILTLGIGQEIGGADSDEAGFDSYSLGYRLPIKNWQLALAIGNYDYLQTIGGAVQTFDYSGESQTASVDVSRLVYRNSTRKITAGMNFWSRRSSNFIEDVEIQNQRRRTAGVDTGVYYREVMGSAVINGSFVYSRGLDMLGAEPAPEESAINGGTARPTILKTSVQLSTPFKIGSQRFQYIGQWRHQQNRDRLVTPDYFSIGNRYTVRGYNGETTVSGERGWVLKNDFTIIREDGPNTMYLGLDYGRVGGVITQPDVKWLGGGVIGWRGNLGRLSYDFSVAWPIRQAREIQDDIYITQFAFNWQF
jgi:hemolysin activation/secretion protein